MKIFFWTFSLKTFLGYLFIQDIKNTNRQYGGAVTDDTLHEIMAAAFVPNVVFFITAILAAVIVFILKDLTISKK